MGVRECDTAAVDRGRRWRKNELMFGVGRRSRSLLVVLQLGLAPRFALAQDAGAPPLELPPVVCIDDAFEPNEATAQATPLTPGVALEAVACSGNVDLYRFSPPVSAGSLFLVTVGFTHALGDIDARLVSFTTGATVTVSEGVSDDERLVARSAGGEYGLLVYLFASAGSGNPYRVDVAAPASNAQNDCCNASAEPGCNDPALNECVCLTDVACCSEAFDALCVTQAVAECGARCAAPAPASDCCSASANPGCSEPAAQACVCAIDPFCCGGRFDQSCANLARAACGASCSVGGAMSHE
jgi:hypothetical protein